jgi:hypothetical protein
VALLILGIYASLVITGVQVRWLSRRSNKTAESIYDNYGDSERKQHRYARQHGETWTDAEGSAPDRPEHIERCQRTNDLSRSPLRKALNPGRQRDWLAPVARYESGAGGTA